MSKSSFPIYIPTKGRAASKRHTYKLFDDDQHDVILVVEPQEIEEYKKAYPLASIIELPENDKGIAFVRNFILNLSDEPFWMLDDDISEFGMHHISNKLKKPVYEKLAADYTFEKVNKLVKAAGYRFGQQALEYKMFSYMALEGKKPSFFHTNGYCDVAVWIDPARAKNAQVRYRGEVNLKEDRDFTIQLLASGIETLRHQIHCFTAPKNGSNAGGLKDVYDTDGREKRASIRMSEIWPGVCKPMIKKDGRQDVKINWQKAWRYYERSGQPAVCGAD